MRGRVVAGLTLAGLLHAACGGGSSVSVRPGLECRDEPVAADTVALRCGGVPSAEARTIEVVIGVPTESTDIAGFLFDVVFDPAILVFEPSSAQAGNLLNQDGASVLFAATLEAGDPGRLVVGITRTGTGGGIQGTAGRDIIMRFTFHAVPGARFEASMPRFENAEARDSTPDVIPTIRFSDQLLLSAR